MVWSESNREIAILNINQSVTALIAGPLIPNDDHEILIIGDDNIIFLLFIFNK